jgi:hypothetical protein
MKLLHPLSKAFSNILVVVVKQTPYEQYLQLKAQGKAPGNFFHVIISTIIVDCLL